MRIAVAVPTFPSPSETFILDHVTGLIDLGHEVRILALRRSRDETVHAKVRDYDLLRRAYYAQDGTDGRSLLRAWSALSRIMVSEPREFWRLWRSAPRKHGLPHRGVVIRAANMLRVHRRSPFEFDIIHCHFGPVGKELLWLKDATDARLVTTFHGYDAGRYMQENGRRTYDLLFRGGDLFLTVSDFISGELRKAGCPERKILRHDCGISLDEIAFRERTKPVCGPVRILTIARLTEKKGLRYSIAAVGRLRERGYDVEYDIAGGGPLLGELRALACDLGLERVVRFAGWCDRTEITRLLEQAHLSVLSSVTASNGDHEGMPVVLREAQAAGLPVVTTAHAGNPEALIDGETGFVVPERDVEGLADRLAYLIDNSELWPRMGRQGREFVRQRFDIDKLNKRVVEIYAGLLGRKDACR